MIFGNPIYFTRRSYQESGRQPFTNTIPIFPIRTYRTGVAGNQADKGRDDRRMSHQIRIRRQPEPRIFYPMMLKQMTDRETREFHLKKLYELSKPELGELEFFVDGSIWKNGKILGEEPTWEQKQWALSKLKAPNYTWRAFSK